MTSQQIEYVLALAQQGSFSKAARSLSVSQPSLSQYIMNVENQVGATLFDRSSSPIKLTAAGEAYLRSAMQIKAIEENLRNELADMADLKTGTLRVGATIFRASCMLPRSIVAFCHNYPGIKVSVTEDSSQSLLEKVLSGEIDVFVGTGTYDRKLFDAEPLAEERLLLAVPADSPLNEVFAGSALTAEDISSNSMKYLTTAPIDLKLVGNERLVVCEYGEFSADMVEEMCVKGGLTPNFALRVHSVETAFAFVKAGFGAAFVPDSMIRFGNYAAHPNYYPLPDAVAKTDISLVYRKSGYLSKAAQEYGLLLKKLVSIGTWRTS